MPKPNIDPVTGRPSAGFIVGMAALGALMPILWAAEKVANVVHPIPKGNGDDPHPWPATKTSPVIESYLHR